MKIIYLEFDFLKKRSKLLIVALTEAVAANISDATIYKTLNIDKQVKNKK